MRLFFEEPYRNFYLREISRITKIAVTSVKNYLVELEKSEMIKKDNKKMYPTYIANQQNRLFKIYKQQIIILDLYSSGLIDFLEDKLYPRCIILFGSMRKGDYDKTSDIDIFIQADGKDIDLSKFEKKLNHKISLYFGNYINKLNKELFDNIINGIVLSGYLKLK